MNKRIELIKFIVDNGGKANCGLSWRKLLKRFNIEVNRANLKKASDWYRYYLRTNKIVPKNSLKCVTEGVKAINRCDSSKAPVRNEELFKEFLEWKKGKVTSYTKPKAKKKFTKEGLHILLGCIHVPFENKKLMSSIQEMIIDNKEDISGFHLIGDFLDLNTLSFYDRGKFPVIKGLTIHDEYREGNKVLDQFDSILSDKTEKSFLYGNHEARWHKYAKDMEKSKTLMESPQKALKLDQRGYHTHDKWDQDFITVGNDLDVMHGQYYSTHNAKKHLDVFKRSIAYAHTHRIQSHVVGDMGGYNIGCLIDRESPAFNYAARATKLNWQNGFATVYVDSEGKYYFNQITCAGGQFYFNGKLYK